MRVDIDVDVSGAIDRLGAIATRMQTIRPLFAKTKQYIRQANISNFTTNGLPVGGWSPLSPSYSSWKMSRFPGTPPMIRTGRLFKSLASLNGPANRATNQEMTFGLEAGEIEYAKFHQFGTSKMPKRKIVFAPPLFAKWIAEQYGDWFMDGTI